MNSTSCFRNSLDLWCDHRAIEAALKVPRRNVGVIEEAIGRQKVRGNGQPLQQIAACLDQACLAGAASQPQMKLAWRGTGKNRKERWRVNAQAEVPCRVALPVGYVVECNCFSAESSGQKLRARAD